MSELIRREDVQREIQTSFDGGAFRWQDGQDLMNRINAIPTASPWHRVEEPPKEVGCYLVVGFDRHWFYDIAEYFPIDNEWAMSENQPDSTYIRYWMHMPEPPKEDADADK